MAKKGDGKKQKKFTKQAITELLDGNEIDLSMSDLTSATVPVKELVHIICTTLQCIPDIYVPSARLHLCVLNSPLRVWCHEEQSWISLGITWIHFRLVLL